MRKFLKKYSDTNPERFNKDFIYSRNQEQLTQFVTDIFKSLEVLKEIKVNSVSIDFDESQLAPIIKKGKRRAQTITVDGSSSAQTDVSKAEAKKKSEKGPSEGLCVYKNILPSRLIKVHYSVTITPDVGDATWNVPILDDEYDSSKETKIQNESSYTIEKDLYLNKLVDDIFYINEGVRYYLIYQIVDNATYGTKNGVSLKSLLMPVTLVRQPYQVNSEGDNENFLVYNFETILFSKRISPVIYYMAKEAYNYLIKQETSSPDSRFIEYTQMTCKNFLNRINDYFGTNLKFGDDPAALLDENRKLFQIRSDKSAGMYISVPKKDLNDDMTRSILGCLLSIPSEVNRKKKIVYTYEQTEKPWFWLNLLANHFVKNNDLSKRFNKVRAVLVSLERLIDEPTRKTVRLPEEAKKNSMSILRYIIKEYETLSTQDSMNLDNKRLRLFEYQLFPLRKYFSDQIYHVLNSTNRSKSVLDKIFSGLNPMKIIKSTITNELLRYYGAVNEFNLYTSLLKFSYTGVQAISNKNVSMAQRDLHPSQVGRLSLIAASPSNPGLNGNICPFVETTPDLFFSEEKVLKKSNKIKRK